MNPLRTRPSLFLPASVSIFLFFLLAVILALPVLASTSEVLHEGSFDPGDMTWDQDAQGRYLPLLTGTTSLAQPGLANLPVQNLYLLVPADLKVAEAWVEPLATHLEKIPGVLSVAPALALSSGELVEEARMSPQDGAFPATWGEFKGTHTWRGYRLLAVGVHPLRQTPQGLEFLDSFAVHVRYDGQVSPDQVIQRERWIPGEAEETRAILDQVVVNSERLGAYARQAGQTVTKSEGGFLPTRTPSLSGSPVQYLIVTNEEMAGEFQRLADHKTAQGINTLVVTREFLAANFRNGADIQETIRMFIQDAYAKWGTEYVLLGGDTDVIPARIITNTFYPASGSTDIPVDLYFACLDGNWNANGNAFYGEPPLTPDPGDDVDFAEEVYVGRATVSSAAAAQVFVNKTIAYENTPAGTPWPGRVLYASEVLFPSEYIPGDNIILDGAQFSHQMVNDLVEPCTDMEKTRMYETDVLFPREAALTKSALVDSLNTGHYGIFNQIGHGFYFNMSVGDANFNNADADALTNGDHLFVLFSLNCASCAFDYSCLMERFLQNPNGGSVVSIGSARAAFPNTSNNYQQEFFAQLYCGGETRVGRLVALSRLPFIANTVYNYVDRWTFENYTLLGDPTLALWTGSPEGTQVSSSSIDLGANSVTVEVNNAFGFPIEGANVCLAREGEDHAYGITGPAGSVVLDYLATAEGEVELVITGRNLAIERQLVPVTGGTSYLAAAGMSVLDSGALGSQGNGNNVIEAGETVALWPSIAETAGGGTTGISAVFSCSDPLVDVIAGDVNFPNVGAGGQEQGDEPILVYFDPAIADGHPLVFDVTVMSDAGTFVSQWETIVKAPEIEVVSLEWEDSTYGNGDDILDSGERVLMSVRIKNFGAGKSGPLICTLRTDNVNVVLYDTLGTFQPLELMESGEGSALYSLELINATRKSESYLLLEDEYGRVVQHDFYLQKPVAPEIIETDTSLGADTIALRWAPSNSADVMGYDVYRSETESGPFVKANSDVIAGVAYFRDEGLDLLTRYYYRIATVDASLVSSPLSITVTQSTAPAEISGFPVAFVDETSGHLAIGDVDGDGDQEIVLAADEVYVWHHDGTELMDGDGDSQSLGPLTDLDSTFDPSGIALAQIDGNSGLEMIVSERGNAQAIHIFRHDGTEVPGWPKSTTGLAGTAWNWATPAVGDVDGDGSPEIVVLTVNGIIWAWHADGTELLDGDNNPATDGVFLKREGATHEWSHCSPALCDLDGDGAKDIIFGTKTDSFGPKRLMALRYDGTDVPGFPYIVSGAIDNSPAIGDLNNDGIMEIVFYDWEQKIYVVQQDGTDYPGFPVMYGIGTSSLDPQSSVALGDLDDDGQLEILHAVFISGNETRLLAFDTDVAGGTSGDLLNGWPKAVPGSSESSPVIGDIDGDSQPDILFGIGGGSEDAPNNLYAFHADGQQIDGFPITLAGPIRPAPVICDLDHDQDVDIVYGGWDREVHVWDMPFAYDRRNVPWPTFGGNVWRDGVFFPLELVGVDDPVEKLPSALKVGVPYPNPFNPSTSVRFYVPGDGGTAELELAVYDLQGRRVRLLHQGAIASGWHTLVWDGRNDRGQGQASGLYFMRARSSGQTSIQKMTLVK